MKKGLCELCFPKQWKTVSSGMLLNDGYPVYGANGVIGFYSEYNHDKKTLLITCRGATCGSLNICEPYSYVNGNAMALDELSEEIDIDYLFYFLLHRGFDDVITGSAQPQIVRESLKKVSIEYPDLVSQKRIAENIKKVEKITALRKKQLQKLDDLVKARFVEMFGDTILNPFGWEKELLGAVCDVRDGTHDSPQYYDVGFPLVTSKNVTGGKINLTDCSMICDADFKKINERSKVDMGDIIMPMIGTVGKPVIVDIEPSFAIKNVSLIKFKSDSKVLNIYIQALLQSDYFDDAVLSKIRGGTQKFISLGDIRALEVLVPAMERQKQFAAFVSQIDKSKLSIQQGLEKLETLKKSLMQQYFG